MMKNFEISPKLDESFFQNRKLFSSLAFSLEERANVNWKVKFCERFPELIKIFNEILRPRNYESGKGEKAS